ncbi:hypothetical protein [Nocardioides sp.]|uniref:hypothetical protein n=1 Tax=Nocardioides sp. TaxID=35761 RepID=UPI003526CC27
MRFALPALCALLLAGCTSTPESGAHPSPEPSVSRRLEVTQVRGPELLEVLPHAQIAAAEGVPAVYAQLMREPRFGAGRDGYPRSVALWLRVGASGGARFDTGSLRAWFRAGDGRQAVAAAPCGSDALPAAIGPDEEVEGCVAFFVPGARGRLQIRGDGPPGAPFAYYLPLDARRA